jgi:hypothetical protein
VCCHLFENVPSEARFSRNIHHGGSIMSRDANHNLVLNQIRHFDEKLKKIGDKQTEFTQSQANGENPDPTEFVKLLQQEGVTATAMTAQFNLYQKPLKTVISDSR